MSTHISSGSLKLCLFIYKHAMFVPADGYRYDDDVIPQNLADLGRISVLAFRVGR